MTNRDCEAMVEDLVAFLDGELTEPERSRVEAHTSTCLTCRREMDRISTVNGMLRSLPRVTPSDDFDRRMWERLEREASRPGAPRSFRAVYWGVPLAAAAALALVWYSSVQQTGTAPGGGEATSPRVATAPQAPAPEAARPDVAVAARPDEAADQEPIAQANADLAPEDFPPEVIEHPELFLRFPVVRRLEKLEHFEEVRTHEEGEPLGLAEPKSGALG